MNKDYKQLTLQKVSESELEEWLKRNHPPKEWQEDKYAWAYTEMPIGKFATWIRKNILMYK